MMEMLFPSGARAHCKTSYEEYYNFIDVEAGQGVRK